MLMPPMAKKYWLIMKLVQYILRDIAAIFVMVTLSCFPLVKDILQRSF